MFLGKGFYPYEYIVDLEKKRKDKEDIVHTDYEDTERVFKDKKIRKIWCLCSKHYTIDVFESFWTLCLKIYELGLAGFPTAPRLAWQAALKKTK